MRTAVTDLLGIDFPLLAFSHCRDVVAAVTNAGGFGVLGASALGPEQLDVDLRWIDEHVGGRPYGADVLVPERTAGGGRGTDPAALVPEAHVRFAGELLEAHGLPAADARLAPVRLGDPGTTADLLEVAFAHPIALIANALGPPPEHLLARARRAGIPVAALVGTRRHAERQLAAGVDLLVAQGGEAGGHTGEVGTMVLVPEVVAAAGGRVPVLAAGGIVTGRQIAAAVALGADGAWTGSVWLTTEEAETAPATREKLLAAGSGDTVRSRGRTGKPARQLRSAWTDAWDDPAGPGALPMPLQSMLAEPTLRRVDAVAASGHDGARRLATYFVGQGVGMLDTVQPVHRVVEEMMEDFLLAVDRLHALTDAQGRR
ncbi:MAG TPA: nitronate monooxygenase [Acidimicrobiales bacterium]|nr:nitronate monooxygenase [Acidimicrobiales bacterium]